MLSERHANGLHILAARLSGTSITWALTGSTGFALQGLPVEPHNIDVQTDEPGAYQIERLFPDEVIRIHGLDCAEIEGCMVTFDVEHIIASR